MAKVVLTGELTPHPRLGGSELLPALTDEEYAALVDSIRESGIKQPLVVAWPEKVILDGHHRWRAAQKLGLTEVPIITDEFSSEARQLALGVELNVARRHLSGEQKRAAAAALLRENPERSDRSIASSVGISPTTVGSVRTEMEERGDVSKLDTRTDTLGRSQPAHRPAPTGRKKDKAPPTWKPERAARAEAVVASLPEDERDAALSLVDEPGIPDVIGVEMVENVAAMAPEARKAVLDLHRSEDARDKSKAKSLAAKQPPLPDPRCAILTEARLTARRALRWCDRDDGSAFRERIEAVVAELKALSEEIHQATRSDAA